MSNLDKLALAHQTPPAPGGDAVEALKPGQQEFERYPRLAAAIARYGIGSTLANWCTLLDELNAALAAIAQGQDGMQAGWHEPTQKPKPGKKIVWLYEDGSGAVLLYVHDDGFIDGEDGTEWRPVHASWMGRWAYLPADTVLSCETGEEPCIFLPAAPATAASEGDGA